MYQEAKTAQIFPGQGLEPKDIITYYQKLNAIDNPCVEEYFALAQETINKIGGTDNFNIRDILQDVDSPNFRRTAAIQPIVYTLSVLASKMGGNKKAPAFVAGHSLGEYSALTKAGVISFEQGIEIVSLRGQVMQEACDVKSSCLIRIMGLTEDEVRNNVCQKADAELALINGPAFIVVGGTKQIIPDIEKLAKEIRGETKVNDLKVAGAFHTSFMADAAKKLDQFLQQYEFSAPRIPVISNLTGEVSNSDRALKNHLFESMINPVQWSKSILMMIKNGVEFFEEVGPGISLAILNSRFNGIPENKTINAIE